jgi:hypothetical protein
MAKWKITEREDGKPSQWTAEFGPLTLELRWHVVDESDGRAWWVLFMQPSPPFDGWVSGNDSEPDAAKFLPNLKRHEVGRAQRAAIDFAIEKLRPFHHAYRSLCWGADGRGLTPSQPNHATQR